jgi:hypothetical protein
MKRILMICVALLGMVLASCHQDEDDLFTTAAITLTAEEGTTVERVQGTVQLTNLNTRQFDGNIARVSLLRGVYSVQVEGSMLYKDAHGATGVRQFRATSDYLEFASKSLNVATLNIVWM